LLWEKPKAVGHAADLSALDGTYGCNRPEKYFGAVLFNYLKTKSKIFKSILK